MHEFERAAEILEGVAANIEAGLIQGPGGPVSLERREAMRSHLRRFVDQGALWDVRSRDNAVVARYFASMLRALAAEDPTDPGIAVFDPPVV